MKVESKIVPFEINGERVKVGDDRFLSVKSVWNKKRCVELDFGNIKITLEAGELLKAISNATDNE